MPQMNKGGKFIFGKSLIREDGVIQFPEQAIREYDITAEGRVYLFTGSKSTGGFCVTRKGLLEPSLLGHILMETPALKDYSAKQGEFIKYKGRSYSWVDITDDGKIVLTNDMMSFLNIEPGDETPLHSGFFDWFRVAALKTLCLKYDGVSDNERT